MNFIETYRYILFALIFSVVPLSANATSLDPGIFSLGVLVTKVDRKML